jgi:signal transduction histidine kinase
VVDVLDDDGNVQRVAAAHFDPSKKELIQRIQAKYPASPKATRGVYRVLETGRSILIPELNDEMAQRRADDPEHLRLMLELGHKSYMCVPLIARGRTVGTILLYSSRRIFGDFDLSVAEELARRFALAVDNARLYREAKEAVRVRDKFLSIAAHELRNPLTMLDAQANLINHALDAIHDGTATDEDLVKMAKVVAISDRAVKRLTKLVNVLLDVSILNCRKMELKRSRVDLADLVHESMQRLQAQIIDSECEVELHEETAVIGMWDQIRLEQVVDNLISNAVKYGEKRPVRISVSTCDGQALLRVEDQGCGISPEDLQHIFRPFQRVGNTSEKEGLGLGLYICRALIEAHQGSVSAKSELGKGSVFEVRLPL